MPEGDHSQANRPSFEKEWFNWNRRENDEQKQCVSEGKRIVVSGWRMGGFCFFLYEMLENAAKLCDCNLLYAYPIGLWLSMEMCLCVCVHVWLEAISWFFA